MSGDPDGGAKAEGGAAQRARRNAAAPRVAAERAPVASLMVDVPLPHLDRPFDYLVPDHLDAEVRAGSRVRVRFAGRLVDGFVLERRDASEHDGQLAFVERSVGEPVLTAQTSELFRAVADRWAGNFVDVVRLGVPARHARTEQSRWAPRAAAGESAGPPDTSAWSAYTAGEAFVRAVRTATPARAVWSALPGEDWPARLAELLATAASGGRGAIAVVPDARDLDRLAAAVGAVLPAHAYVALSADLGASVRYRRWLAVRRGDVRVVIGTRAAVYAPVAALGLLAIWDDGDDLYDEPRAPYAHSRDVLMLRSTLSGAALLVGGVARTAEAAQLLRTGWAHSVEARRARARSAAPRTSAVADDIELSRDAGAAAARLPSLAWRTARTALEAGRPVLVQVPRRGYVPVLACARDRTPARCPACSGPLSVSSGHAVPTCRWCGRPAGSWRCPVCGAARLRAVVVGAVRTAEELGRAFPGVRVLHSGGDRVLASVADSAALVVATPGAEPVTPGGYGAALLLDGWAMLSRPDLRAGEETLRRWFNAAMLVRTDGEVVVGADAGVPAVQALIRWDPAGAADRELADRAELDFPPVSRMASLTGAGTAPSELIEAAELPPGTQVLGPVPAPDSGPARSAGRREQRVLLRVHRSDGMRLARALKAAAGLRSARKAPEPVRIVLDPYELG